LIEGVRKKLSAAPLSIAVLVAASWALRPERRQLPGATIRLARA